MITSKKIFQKRTRVLRFNTTEGISADPEAASGIL